MRCVSVAPFGAVVLLWIALGLFGSPVPDAEAQSTTVRAVAVSEAAARIRRDTGRVRVVLLYAATCPASRRMFPEFVRFADRSRRQNVSILAFSTDDSPAILQAYLGGQALPFARVHIRPWRRGELDAAMRPLGIDIGTSFGTPLIAVLDRKGKVVGQWEGESGVRRAEQWLLSLGLRAR